MTNKLSNCCQAKVIFEDVCSDCKEHCEVVDADDFHQCIGCKGTFDEGASEIFCDSEGQWECEECWKKRALEFLPRSFFK